MHRQESATSNLPVLHPLETDNLIIPFNNYAWAAVLLVNFDLQKSWSLRIGLLVQQIIDALQPLRELESEHQFELEAPFGDHGIDYSRGLVLVDAVLLLDKPLHAMNIVNLEDCLRKPLDSCWLGAGKHRHKNINLSLFWNSSKTWSCNWQKGRFRWGISIRMMTFPSPIGKWPFSGVTTVPSPPSSAAPQGSPIWVTPRCSTSWRLECTIA